ncbi:MAG: PAS domain S-box protein [Proteobacteria bacterium]|nr:PAS domain S-box protein [Pseudomonadota bacterium]MBU1714252.1 PAS domain S-box protein [Pseudomonadota bacterium]
MMKRFQKLFAASPQGIIFSNSRDEITHWNPMAETIFGWSSSEAIGRNLTEMIINQVPDIAQRWGSHNRNDLSLQAKLVSTSGEIHLVEFLITAGEVDEQDEPYRIVIANDISHQWLREEQLQRSVRLQVVMNTILHVAMLDEPVLKQLQMLLDLILAIPTLNILPMGAILVTEGNPPQLVLKVHKGLTREHVSTCSIVPKGRCYCGQAVEEEMVVHDGNCILAQEWEEAPCRTNYPEAVHYSIPIMAEERTLGVLVLFLERPVGGPHSEIETMLAVANVLAAVLEREDLRREQDELISHLKLSNKSMQEEKKFSESIIASLLNGLLILDNDGQVVACNPEGKKLLDHFFPGELVGRKLSEIVGEEMAKLLLADSTDAEQFAGIRKKMKFTSISGAARLIEYNNFPRVNIDGEREGSILSFSDITEADRLVRKLEKMNRFSTIAEIASAVAHEVRNPLAGIKAISQGVESTLEPDDRNRKSLQRITNQVDRLNVILTDFFTYARPPKPQKKMTDLGEIVGKVIPLLQSRAQKSSIVINNRLGKNLSLIVVDPNQMQQVFLNLFLNALDAIPVHGWIEVSAEDIGLDRSVFDERRFAGLPRDKPYLVVRIKDSGAGMSSEVLEKLFEPFFSTKTTGTGLGLAIVMRIMKEHNALIYAESVVQQGTEFFLFFRKD